MDGKNARSPAFDFLAPSVSPSPPAGARTPRHGIQRSLPEVYGSIFGPLRRPLDPRLLAFAGPGYLVSVGYMDPGNWATDLAGGSKFGYTLLSVILLSNLMAILLQALAARLGIVTDRDLAQACRATYSRPVNFMLWLACEAAIIACDLAEVIGTAIALKLLFGIPLIGGALITALDAFLLLLLMNKGFRFLEAFVIALLIVIAVCFAIQITAAAPPVAAMLRGFVPSTEIFTNPEMLYIAIGIIGATVMPHNLYLHSSIVQTRAFERHGRRPPRRDQMGDDRLHHRADAGSVHQCRHSRRRGRHVPHQRSCRRRRNRPGIRAVVAAARPRHRIDAVRRGAARLRPQLDGDGDARRPDRDGRFSAICGCRAGRGGCSPAASPSSRSSSSPRSMANAAPHSFWCSARSCCRCSCRSP